jgi:hypothetical protein
MAIVDEGDILLPYSAPSAADLVLTSTGTGAGDIEWKAKAVAGVNDFRLTLTSGMPVTTADVSAAGTIYMTPYKGNSIGCYDGSNWQMVQTTELSVAVPASANQVFDIFLDWNSAVPQLVTSNWTNDTTRATALTYQDGVLVQTGNTDWRYLGTARTKTVSQVDDAEAFRHLWNYYNRVEKHMAYYPTTSSWTDAATYTWRQWNSDTAIQLDFVIGVSEDIIRADSLAIGSTTVVNSLIGTAIGEDSTTSASQNATFGVCQVPTSGVLNEINAHYKNTLAEGRHYLALLERAGGGTTTTWRGQAGDSQSYHTGINGVVKC